LAIAAIALAMVASVWMAGATGTEAVKRRTVLILIGIPVHVVTRRTNPERVQWYPVLRLDEAQSTMRSPSSTPRAVATSAARAISHVLDRLHASASMEDRERAARCGAPGTGRWNDEH
jgi:hypothetical protein